MVSEVTLDSLRSSVDMTPLVDMAGRQLGEIRPLDAQHEADRQIASMLDAVASESDSGAINPFDSSTTGTMTPEQLRVWMTDDVGHALRVYEWKGASYGFGYEYNDCADKNDARYDPGQESRFRFLKERGAVSSQAELTEFNWWYDLADTTLPEGEHAMREDLKQGWVIKSLVGVFERHKERYQKSGEPYKELTIMKAFEPDEGEDIELARRIGFTVAAEKRDYDTPNKVGQDTMMVLTQSRFAKALENLSKPSH